MVNVPDFSQAMHDDPSFTSGSGKAPEAVAPASVDAASKTSIQQKLAKRVTKKGGSNAASGFGAKVKGIVGKTSSQEFPGGVDRATARRIAKAIKWVLLLDISHS